MKKSQLIISVLAIVGLISALICFYIALGDSDVFVGVIISIALSLFSLRWVLANEFAEVAEQKGYAYEKFFWLCFLLGNGAYLLVIALPSQLIQDDNA